MTGIVFMILKAPEAMSSPGKNYFFSNLPAPARGMTFCSVTAAQYFRHAASRSSRLSITVIPVLLFFMAFRACAISSLLSETSTTLRDARAALMSAWIAGTAASSSAPAGDRSAGASVIMSCARNCSIAAFAALVSSRYWQS